MEKESFIALAVVFLTGVVVVAVFHPVAHRLSWSFPFASPDSGDDRRRSGEAAVEQEAL
jgi:hypothetical protein